jgi:hypothetical protein
MIDTTVHLELPQTLVLNWFHHFCSISDLSAIWYYHLYHSEVFLHVPNFDLPHY